MSATLRFDLKRALLANHSGLKRALRDRDLMLIGDDEDVIDRLVDLLDAKVRCRSAVLAEADDALSRASKPDAADIVETMAKERAARDGQGEVRAHVHNHGEPRADGRWEVSVYAVDGFTNDLTRYLFSDVEVQKRLREAT